MTRRPAQIYYDNDFLSLADLQNRKEVLQNSSSLTDPEADELRMLVQLFADLAPYAAYRHRGPSLIREDAFPTFVRGLVESVTGYRCLDRWPYSCLDWECVVAQVRAEHLEIEFMGNAYWVKVGERVFGH